MLQPTLSIFYVMLSRTRDGEDCTVYFRHCIKIDVLCTLKVVTGVSLTPTTVRYKMLHVPQNENTRVASDVLCQTSHELVRAKQHKQLRFFMSTVQYCFASFILGLWCL